MNQNLDNTYWIAVAHLPGWSVERINRLIIRIIHEHKISWTDFFALGKKEWADLFDFTEKELINLDNTKSDIPRLAFIAEQLQNEGFEIIPINSPYYPATLKTHLKTKSAPPVLYIKGRKGLLQEDAVAIVGSRKAGAKALSFTDHVAKKCAGEHKVVVSGFAKGVDRQALDSALATNGKSIIVLPQGILTFQSGFKQYYAPIVHGDVLVLSTFFPKAGWEVGFAMARNAYIYGLANEIYVAESDSKGGTWEGAMDGLKRGRNIYVRHPDSGEKTANQKLIELGAIPVNMDGEFMDLVTVAHSEPFQERKAQDSAESYQTGQRNIEKEILDLLDTGTFTAKEIALKLHLDWETRKLTSFLKKNPNVKSMDGRPAKFTRTETTTLNLFE